MSFKTTVNCLFNDICYLVIDSFIKISVFQQTVVGVYYCILKLRNELNTAGAYWRKYGIIDFVNE